MHRIVASVMAALLFALTACGGTTGDEPTSPPNFEPAPSTQATLQGTYFYAMLSHREGESDDSTSETGIFVADGMGGLDMTALFRNDNGTVGGPLEREMRYDLAADNSIGLRIGATRFWIGGIGSSGRYLVAATILSDTRPSILVAARKSDLLRDGFDADYHLGAYAARAFGPSCALWGTHTFTRGRGLSVSGLFQNQVGATAITGPESSAGGTYSITEGGDITLGMYPGYTLLGGRAEEDVIIAGGDILSPIDPMIYVGIPHTTRVSLATFQGQYWSIATQTRAGAPPDDNASMVSLSTVNIDGQGGIFYETTLRNTEGQIDSSSGADTYTVTADGTLTLGGGVTRGGITGSGSFAFVAGDLRDGLDPTFRVFIRK